MTPWRGDPRVRMDAPVMLAAFRTNPGANRKSGVAACDLSSRPADNVRGETRRRTRSRTSGSRCHSSTHTRFSRVSSPAASNSYAWRTSAESSHRTASQWRVAVSVLPTAFGPSIANAGRPAKSTLPAQPLPSNLDRLLAFVSTAPWDARCSREFAALREHGETCPIRERNGDDSTRSRHRRTGMGGAQWICVELVAVHAHLILRCDLKNAA